MTFREEQRQYTDYTLDWFAERLGGTFHSKAKAAVVVKPAKFELGAYSIFENFLQCDQTGQPLSYETGPGRPSATEQLRRLLSNAIQQNNGLPSTSGDDQQLSVEIVGFSKGCVVLNKLIHELAEQTETGNRNIRITRLVFLDGGHSGGPTAPDVWINNLEVIDQFCKLNIPVSMHVSPYQVKSTKEPWKGQQEAIFTRLLTANGCNVERTLHFGDQKPSIENHFHVIDAFCDLERDK